MFRHGDYCQELVLNPVWDTMITNNSELFYPRASHKSIVVGDRLWIYGGIIFTSEGFLNHFSTYDFDRKAFINVLSRNDGPFPRYDHSLVLYEVSICWKIKLNSFLFHWQNKLYIFGGVVNQSVITNEFWVIIVWITNYYCIII